MYHDGKAFGFFRCSTSFPLEKHVIKNLGRERSLPSLLEIWSIDDLGIFREDTELLKLAERAKKAGHNSMIQMVCATTNHAAAAEMSALFKDAHRYLKDLKTGAMYYKRGTNYARYH